MGMRKIFGKWLRLGRGGDTILGRLAGDTRGNVLAIMAAALIPFCGMVGGGLDLSRMYLTKTRLQHACDAGALAGRKRMGSGTWTANSNASNAAAVEYFNANYTSTGMYGGAAPTVAFTESAGKVTGNASAVVPMTLMRVLGKTQETLSVTCDAEMRLPNTDIMFVLDTTGSMESPAVSTDSQTKIAALRSAVKCFYEIVARLDTTEVCTTGAPSGGTGGQVQVRFGFVPYATNVNVGRLLPTSYFADTWSYQTRTARTRNDTVTTTTNGPWVNGTPTVTNESVPLESYTNWFQYRTYTTNQSSNCDADPDSPMTYTGPEGAQYDVSGPTESGNSRTTTWKTQTPAKREYKYQAVYNSGSNVCSLQRRINYGTSTRTWRRVDTRTTTSSTTTTSVFDGWRYAKLPVDIRGLKNGTTWNASFDLPIGNTPNNAVTPSMKTIIWDGCIEERTTIKASAYTSATGGTARDLDIDTPPTTGDADSLWGPALYGLIYARGSFANDLSDNDIPGFNRNELNDANNYATIDGRDQDSYFCPSEARTMQQWPTASGFESYVDGLTTGGNTYHDIGLIWGARFLSPTGIFQSTNALTPQGGEIDRNLIFMTDGETCTSSVNYGAYGIPWYDRRQTADNAAPSFGCETELTTGGALSEQVKARYDAVCTAVKNKNITLWVIWFGVSKPNLEARLTSCATTGRFYAARNAAALQTTFATIANQISQLRLTK